MNMNFSWSIARDMHLGMHNFPAIVVSYVRMSNFGDSADGSDPDSCLRLMGATRLSTIRIRERSRIDLIRSTGQGDSSHNENGYNERDVSSHAMRLPRSPEGVKGYEAKLRASPPPWGSLDKEVYSGCEEVEA